MDLTAFPVESNACSRYPIPYGTRAVTVAALVGGTIVDDTAGS